MEKKVRLIIIGLIAISAISIIFSFSLMGSKAALMKEYQFTKERLTDENKALTRKINVALEERRKAEGRAGELQGEIDKLLNEQEELKNKYSLLNKEKEELLQRLQREPSVLAPPAAGEPATTRPSETEDAYWARILKEKAYLELTAEKLRERLDKFVIAIEELKKDKLALGLEMKNVTLDKQNLERRFVYNEKIIDSLSSELVREKKEKRKIEKELETLTKERLTLSQQLKKLNEENVSLEKTLAQVKENKIKLETRLTDLDRVLESKIFQVEQMKQQLEIAAGEEVTQKSLKESVELPPIVVRSQEEAKREYQEIPGKVLAVNREHNFIVIDLGKEQGVNRAQLFDVFRAGRKIATVEVIQTRGNISACDIKTQETNIKVGDSIR